MLFKDLYKNYFGAEVKDYKGTVGIEFEVEAELPLPRAPKGWVEHAEGSLRNGGKEYVSDGPLVIDASFSEKLDDILIPINKARPVKDSPRTSVHVHRNIVEYKPSQIYSIACVYWLFENLLFKYCGAEREGNHFCLRLSDSEGLIRTLIKDIRSNFPFFSYLHADNIKYSGLNLATIQRFGSIEFRGMRGVYDKEIVERWCRELDNMVNTAALLFSSPDKLMDFYFKTPREVFLTTFFSREFADTLKALDPNWIRTIDQNSGLISGLAYLHDWDKWSARIEKSLQKERPKKVDLLGGEFNAAEAIAQVRARPLPPLRWDPEPGQFVQIIDEEI